MRATGTFTLRIQRNEDHDPTRVVVTIVGAMQEVDGTLVVSEPAGSRGRAINPVDKRSIEPGDEALRVLSEQARKHGFLKSEAFPRGPVENGFYAPAVELHVSVQGCDCTAVED